MQIWIHDNKMKKIVALNNDIPDMLSYSNSTWHSYLDQATSTFDFTIPKFLNGELHEDIKLINDECFVSFYVNGSYQVFYIATLQEDDFNIQLTCNNTNLEYALEYANPFSAGGAQTIEWYLNHMELLSFASVELGYNEIPDRKRTLAFDSQETKMARLQSLMSNFDAEFEFKVELNRDGTYKRIVINVYQKADDTHHGIGSDRKDVVLYYSNGLKGVQVSSDKTQMFNAGVFTGKDGLSLNDVEISEKNADGIEEFYSRKGSPLLYAPIAMNRYQATMRAEGQDNWIRKDFTTEYENVNDLKAYALRTLKQYAYPLMTYTASVQSDFISNYTDLKLGDTVRIIDKNFAGGLALEARVSEMIISFDNPNNNSIVFTNYRKIDNKPTSALQTRIDKAVEDRLPYRIELATTGGVTFKNNEGETIVKPSLYRGNLPYTTDVSWRWALDGTVTVGMQYLVKAKDIDETAVLTVAGYVGNTEVATTEITLTNVNDGVKGPQGEQGPQGPKGDKGEDGIAGKDGVGLKSTVVTYGLSASETTRPTSWTEQVPALTKGKYLWTKTVWTYTDNTNETGYQKTYIAKDGNDGNDGIAGKDGVGIKSTTITYASSTSGITKPTSGWSSAIPSVPAGNYLWTKTVWTYTDNTSETGYSVAKMGENGRSEVRRETFYKLTNNAAVPEVPSVGGRNYLHGTSSEYQTYTSSNYVLGFPSTYRDWTKLLDPLRGKTVTVKAYIKNDTDFPVRIQVWANTGGVQANTVAPRSEGWSVGTGKMSSDWTSANVAFVQSDNAGTGGTIQAKEAKVEISETATPWSPAPEDAGWSTDTLVPTQQQRYLWKFEYVYYSDGSVEVIRPVNLSIAGERGPQGVQGLQGPKGDQGIPGEPGADGRTQYTHIAYADNATGGGFSQTDQTKAYIGMYVDFTATDSNDPTKYRWSKWHGDKGATGAQGIQGPKGDDGRTPYLHIAYANSADGRTDFSTSNTDNKRYLGTYTDYTQADSTDPTKYKWVDMVGSVDVGGRNLLTGTRDWSSNIQRWSNNNGVWNDEAEDYNNLKVKSTTGGWNGWHQNVFVKAGDYYTLSYYAKADTNINVKNSLTWEQSPIFKGPVAKFDGSNDIPDNITTEWKRYSRTVKITGDGSLQWRIEYDASTIPGGKWYIAGMKLERGTVATDWSPAPEDTQSDIDSKADSALTQEQLNALEAKRLQMEVELKAKATLEQVSELETFVNNLKQEEADGRQKIIEVTKAIEERVKDIEPIMEYSQKLKFMDTYITQGNGGMIIGANDSTTKVVVTPDRISFQSGGSEVAYISQRMLHIDNGVFTLSLQLGHYITRAHPKNEYVNATYFVK